MGTLLFVIKTLTLTVILVVVLQIEWGENTLEETAMDFVHESRLLEPLREASQGAHLVIKNSWKSVSEKVNQSLYGIPAAARSEVFKLKRSVAGLVARGNEAGESQSQGQKTKAKKDSPVAGSAEPLPTNPSKEENPRP